MQTKKRKRRKLPKAADPEVAVIHVCLCNAGAIHTAAKLVKPEYFLDDDYRAIYRTMLEVNQSGIPLDFVTAAHALPETNRIRLQTMMAETMSDVIAIPAMLPHYAAIMADNKLESDIADISEDTELTADDKVARIQELKRGVVDNSDRLFDAAGVQEVLNGFNRDKPDGLYFRSGIDELDNLILGFRPGTVTALQALYKTGKTKFLIQVMCEALKTGTAVGFMSLEMSRKRLRSWFLSYLCRIDSFFFHNPYHAKWNQQRQQYFDAVAEKVSALDDLLIYVSDIRRPKIDEVMSIIGDWARRGVKLIGIDYFERMDTGQDWKDEGAITSRIADAAAMNDVAIIYIDQLNKSAEVSEGVNWAYSRGSTARNADADLILQMVNKSRRKRQTEIEKMAALEMSLLGRDVPSGIKIDVIADLSIGSFRGKEKSG